MGFLWRRPGAAVLCCIVMSSPLMFSCSRFSQLCQFYFSCLPVFNRGVVAFSICLVLLCFFFLCFCWIYVNPFFACFRLVCVHILSYYSACYLTISNSYCGCESNKINNCSKKWKLNHYIVSGGLWIKVSGATVGSGQVMQHYSSIIFFTILSLTLYLLFSFNLVVVQ